MSAILITITGEPPEGVDSPWFEMSHGGTDTVQWKNQSGKECTVTITGGNPFPHKINLVDGASSSVFSASNAPGPPSGWPSGKVYKVYKYDVDCVGGNSFDPGGGVRP